MGVCEFLVPTWSRETSTALHGPLETSATAACIRILMFMDLGVLVSSWMLPWFHLVAHLVSAMRHLSRPVVEERSTGAMNYIRKAGGTGVSGFLVTILPRRETPVPRRRMWELRWKDAGATRAEAGMHWAEGRWSGRFRARTRLHVLVQFTPPTVVTFTD